VSESEREVLQHIATGKSNQEIASALRIAESTVKFHVNNILSKLGVSNRAEAAIAALNRGIAKLWTRPIHQANFILSSDKDLLVLHPFQGIEILTAADFLAKQ